MTLETLQAELEHVLEKGDPDEIRLFLDQQNISDVAELIYTLPEYDASIISYMSIHRASGVFKILETSTQQDIIQQLPPSKTAELLNELPPDDRTALLEDLPSGVVRELIKLLNPSERKITLSLLGYPENSVGRLMTPDYVYVYEKNTVKEVLEIIRRVGKNSETIDVIYVINEKGELLDDIRIREFILASPDKRVSELMDDRVIALNAYDDQEVANEAFKMNNRVALPVVSNSNKLLGIVTIDDILWVANEEFSEDMQKIGGTEALDEPYLEMPLFRLLKKRVVWLVVLFLGEMLTATAMAYFEDEIAKATVLALFIPLIISSGGNSGSQASTLIIQAMAVGEITVKEWWRVMRREIISGIMLGAVLGTIGFLRILLWHSIKPSVYGEHWMVIGLTVGIALIGVVLWGTLCGSMLPMILKRLGADPAVSSAPFVATLVDVTGLIIYFSVAFLILSGRLL
ncbi:magnesium transporter [Flavisolibacter nicotianae]|uniref:magnesium transporter n=1 Tax=Flavisolibacter nicotianae TaxID=2364882 RepID=UPI000EAD5917|nr:magnesium transporter [Flavisolibacter nicotianae]